MLNKREKEVLEEILKKDDITIDYLSKYFNISIRTVYYDIKNINNYLMKNNYSKIIVKYSKIFILSKEEIIECLNNLDSNLELTKEDIQNIILLYAIFNSKGLNLSNLSKKLFINRNKLKKEMLSLENFTFNYNSKMGYYLNLENDKKIDFLLKIYNNVRLKKFIDEIIDFNLIEKIENFIREITSIITINTNEKIYRMLIITIYVKMKYKEDNIKSVTYIFEDEREKIKKIFEKYFDDEYFLNEMIDLIVGLSINPDIKTYIDISYLVKKMINFIGKEINLNLIEDEILFDFLYTHIKVSIYRLKKNIILNENNFEDITIEKDSLFNIIKKSLIEIEKIYKIKFIDTEINLITYHFKAAITRINNLSIKRVILVCSLGYGTSRILEYWLKEKFDIEIVDVLPSYMIHNLNLKNKNIDYILSTVELKNIEYIKINPLLKENDLENLKKLGFRRRKDKINISEIMSLIQKYNIKTEKEILEIELYKRFPNLFIKKMNKSKIISLLNEDNIIFKENVSNWQEAINILGKNLEKRGSISNRYTKKMIETVNKIGPYIVIEDGIAIPHANSNDGVFKLDISILIIKEGVMFEDNKKVYFLLAFSTPDKNSHIEIIKDLYKVIINENFLNDLFKINSYIKLIEYFENILEKRK